jgi:ribosomal protein S18 acetylase RimI-like enzyme
VARVAVPADGGRGVISMVYTAPDHRRQGLCNKVLGALMDKAGAQSYMLEVAADNEAAISCYTRARFKFGPLTNGHYIGYIEYI